MAFVPVLNTARVELRFTQDGQQVANVFHVKSTVPLTVSALNAIGDVFQGWFSDHLPIVSTSVQLREMDIRDLTTASGIGILYSTGLPLTGTVSGTQAPNSVTIAIKWGTGLSGRSFRGRTYHVGLATSQVSANEVANALIAPLLASYNALITLVSEADFSLVVVSRVSNNVPRVSGVTTPILTASLADTTLDNQRRRLPGRGR